MLVSPVNFPENLGRSGPFFSLGMSEPIDDLPLWLVSHSKIGLTILTRAYNPYAAIVCSKILRALSITMPVNYSD